MKQFRSIGIVGTIVGLIITVIGWNKYSLAAEYVRALKQIGGGSGPSLEIWKASESNFRIVLVVGAIILLIGLILLIASFMTRKEDGGITEKTDPASQDASKKMIELKSMLDGGLISNEEYEQKRADILDKM